MTGHAGMNYVVTAHKPTAVTHSVMGHFTSANDLNLIVAKCTRIEVHLLVPEGLQPVMDAPIYGRIACMELFRPPGQDADCLFILTERYKICVLKYNEQTGDLETLFNGKVDEKVGRPTDQGQLGIIDPDCRMIGLHLYDGNFKVIPIDDKGSIKEAFNIRLEELQVLDIVFLHGCTRPTIAVLYTDPKEQRHIKTYEVVLKDKDFVEGPSAQSNLDAGASMIIPVPMPIGGMIIVGANNIVYLGAACTHTLAIPQPELFMAYGRVDADGSRFLLSDGNGMLHLLALGHDRDRVLKLKLEPLGRTSVARSISYLDNGIVYVGSQTGDSQLIRLNTEPDMANEGSFVEVMDTYTNLGPITDLCVVDLERQGQGQVVTTSGVGADGTLRVVRNGIGINEQATVEVPGIKGMWSLRRNMDDRFDEFLLVTFISETRLLAINAEDELEETEIAGFASDAQTLFCCNAVHNQFVQVTSTALRLVSASTQQLLNQWTPPAGYQINVATATSSQVLLATGGGNLVYVEVGNGQLTEIKSIQLHKEISCLDLHPIGANPEEATMAAVGLWSMEVCVYALPTLEPLTREVLGGEVIPRSVLFCAFEGVPYLLVALGDGHLFNFLVDTMSGALSDRKKISLGTQPITLSTFRSKNTTHVFAASDRPTVIYSSNKKLLYSNVNLREVSHMCPFNSAAFPDSLAISVENNLTIGTIDDIQKLHIRTVKLNEFPRRIVHQEQTRTFGILTVNLQTEQGFVRLLDAQTFEVIDTHTLQATEMPTAITSCSFADDTNVYYCVGTAFIASDEQEPSKGRILLLKVEDYAAGGKLQLVAEAECKGAVYTLNGFQGKLLATVNARVQLYGWVSRDGCYELSPECTHHGSILALYAVTRGDFIIVGDLMKSVTLLIYKPEEGVIETLARDFNAMWMTAVEALDDDTYLGAENSLNLFTLRKNSEAGTDDERSRLEVVGDFHLGEFINRFRHGSLVMRLPDSEAAQIPTVIFGTINGVIGVVASLPPELFVLVQRLETALNKVVKGVGGLSHAEWRSFSNEHRNTDGTHNNFIDGDLIESFLDLKKESMDDVAKIMEMPVEELCKKVEELTRLH